jgi:hypothetical protein
MLRTQMHFVLSSPRQELVIEAKPGALPDGRSAQIHRVR